MAAPMPLFSEPLSTLVLVCAVLSAVCWVLSVVTREYSWVDRIWSLAPPAYLWMLSVKSGFAEPRLTLMTALATAWGVRLTYNFARKGGYRKGGEDYRWAVLRERLGPVGFQLFNATFLAPGQNVILLLLALPGVAALEAHTPLGPFDAVLTVLFLVALAGETVADEQQWRFQTAKAARRARGEAGADFCTEGLFRISRHPNFFFELSMWWLMYGFAVAATGAAYHWTIAGAVVLTLLFQGSTAMTEGISKSKYPAYAGYQATTSRLIPWLPAKSPPR